MTHYKCLLLLLYKHTAAQEKKNHFHSSSQPLVGVKKRFCCKIFMIRDKLLSFFSATAQESDVKEIHFHVDFKSIKFILRAFQRKYKHIEKGGLPE